MKRVLIPIDGSDCALRGVSLIIAQGADDLDPENVEIHLVNVQAPFSHDISRFASHQQIAAFHREESDKVVRGACRLLDAAGFGYTLHQEVGKVAETITGLAETLHCDQIVMGTHGRGALAELLTGSTALKVMHRSRISLLLVK